MYELSHLYPSRVFLRRDALDAGYDDRDIARMMRGGIIVRVRHGAYTVSEVWDVADDLERHRLRCHAVLASHGDDVVLSHTSATIMQGYEVLDPDLSRVHLTRLDGRASKVCTDVRYHRGTLSGDDLAGIPQGGLMTSGSRACVDHASLTSVEAGLVTMDSYLHHNRAAGVDAMKNEFASRSRWPGSRRLQITLRLARIGAESVGESRFRFLCWEFHLPAPELQVPVFDAAGHLVGTVDFGWQARGVYGEFDGKVKYERYVRPGELSGDAVFREKKREDRIREATGFKVVRFTWEDLYRREATAARVRRALG